MLQEAVLGSKQLSLFDLEKERQKENIRKHHAIWPAPNVADIEHYLTWLFHADDEDYNPNKTYK